MSKFQNTNNSPQLPLTIRGGVGALKTLLKFIKKHLTDRGGDVNFYRTREICTPESRDMASRSRHCLRVERQVTTPKAEGVKDNFNLGTGTANQKTTPFGAAIRKPEKNILSKLSENLKHCSVKNDLVVFFRNKNHQSDRDNHQGSENVYIGHGVINIHDFDKDTLKNQQTIAKANPKSNIGQLNKPLVIGPTNTDPNKTCPMSRSISEMVWYFTEDKAITYILSYQLW